MSLRCASGFVFGLALVVTSAAMAQEEKKVSWPRAAEANNSCDATVSYRLRIFPDKIGFGFAAGWEYFKADANGKVAATTTLPGGSGGNGGATRLTIQADLKARTGRVENSGSRGCVWAGSF